MWCCIYNNNNETSKDQQEVSPRHCSRHKMRKSVSRQEKSPQTYFIIWIIHMKVNILWGLHTGIINGHFKWGASWHSHTLPSFPISAAKLYSFFIHICGSRTALLPYIAYILLILKRFPFFFFSPFSTSQLYR